VKQKPKVLLVVVVVAAAAIAATTAVVTIVVGFLVRSEPLPWWKINQFNKS